MKYAIHILFCIGLLWPVALMMAQNSDAPVSAYLQLSQTTVFERETFQLTLNIKTDGVKIREQLNLKNLPEKQQVTLFTPFETLPTQRSSNGHRITEIHRYRCRAWGLTPGRVTIAPTLQLVALRRRRLLIGSAWEEIPLNLTLPPMTLTVKPLPDAAPPSFSGAVGRFTFHASVSPTNIAPGELVTLTTRISGEGYLESIDTPQLPNTPSLKTYPPTIVSDDIPQVYTQILIPQSTNVTAIPALSFTAFDTEKGRYTTQTQGPFPLCFHTAKTNQLEHFRPTDTPAPDSLTPTEVAPQTWLDRTHRFLGAARHHNATTQINTPARIAPALSAHTTFTLSTNITVMILQRQAEWILIESNHRRGWIPVFALD